MGSRISPVISEVHFSVRPNHRLLSGSQRVFLSGKSSLINPCAAPSLLYKRCSAVRPSQAFAARQRQVVR
jgi:hypothetical protein